tara:strand:- start:365 stop:628 length:264 start_codon:yes stop_codon:yes gene_type:complete
MKKLTKKQQNIITSLETSLEIDFKVLRDYKEADDYKMTSHMQSSIKGAISGVIHYLIHSDLKSYCAVEEHIDNMKDAPELQVSYLPI